MRRLSVLFLAASLGCVAHVAPVHHRVQDGHSFHEVLAPHGEWVLVVGHGWAWRPHAHVVGVDFVPYLTGGRWIHTQHGWVFSSRWGWGWAPFHYGGWADSDEYGWIWFPGTEWRAAWVEWRYGAGMVGWVPMPPAHWGRRPHVHRWCFVRSNHFTVPEVHRHRLMAAELTTAYEQTAVPASEPERRVGPPTSLVAAAQGRAVTDEPFVRPGPLSARAMEPPPERFRAVPHPGAVEPRKEPTRVEPRFEVPRRPSEVERARPVPPTPMGQEARPIDERRETVRPQEARPVEESGPRLGVPPPDKRRKDEPTPTPLGVPPGKKKAKGAPEEKVPSLEATPQ